MKSIWIYEFCSDIAFFFINIYKRISCKKILIGRGARVNIWARMEGYNKIERNTIFAGDLGRFSYIGANSLVVGKVGRFCSIGGNVTFLGSTHPTTGWISTHPSFYSTKKQVGISFTRINRFNEYPKKEGHTHSIEVGNDVYIGFGATIIGPVSIGDGAIVAACSVVTKDVPPYAVVAGNPARILRYRFEPNEIDTIQKSQWWNNDVKWFRENSEKFNSYATFCDIYARK